MCVTVFRARFPLRFRLLRERKDGIRGATNLERPGLLKILALEEEARPGDRIERCGGQDGGAMNARGYARVGLANGLPRGCLIIHWFGRWSCAHGAHFWLFKLRVLSGSLLNPLPPPVKEALWHVRK